jgi:hypothetical protein
MSSGILANQSAPQCFSIRRSARAHFQPLLHRTDVDSHVARIHLTLENSARQILKRSIRYSPTGGARDDPVQASRRRPRQILLAICTTEPSKTKKPRMIRRATHPSNRMSGFSLAFDRPIVMGSTALRSRSG